jgi:hypothetical protein
MINNELEKWEKEKQKGILRYLLFKGIIRVGLPVSISLGIIDVFIELIKGDKIVFSFLFFESIKIIIIFILVGFGSGITRWFKNESDFKFIKVMKNKKTNIKK